jgi:hypothetical protein
MMPRMPANIAPTTNRPAAADGEMGREAALGLLEF